MVQCVMFQNIIKIEKIEQHVINYQLKFKKQKLYQLNSTVVYGLCTVGILKRNERDAFKRAIAISPPDIFPLGTFFWELKVIYINNLWDCTGKHDNKSIFYKVTCFLDLPTHQRSKE